MGRRVLRCLGDSAGAALAHRGQRDQELGRGSPLLPPPLFQRWLAPAAVLLVILSRYVLRTIRPKLSERWLAARTVLGLLRPPAIHVPAGTAARQHLPALWPHGGVHPL